jgi:ABC-type sulfate transport system permease component
VWSDGLGAAFATSLGIAVVVTAATIALAVPAAFALDRTGSTVWRALGLILLAVGLFQPTEVLLIPLFSLLQGAGLLDTTAGVILPEIARILPLAVLLIWGALHGLPGELLQAAAVDGEQMGWIVGDKVRLPFAVCLMVRSRSGYADRVLSALSGALSVALRHPGRWVCLHQDPPEAPGVRLEVYGAPGPQQPACCCGRL